MFGFFDYTGCKCIQTSIGERMFTCQAKLWHSVRDPPASLYVRTGGENRAARVFDVRPLPHFERRVSHSERNRAEDRQEWGGQGTGGHPLKGQRCSFGRQPSLGPRRMRWAVGEAISLATPALCMSRQEQTLCHSTEVGFPEEYAKFLTVAVPWVISDTGPLIYSCL
jgi:hypothetical protein